MNKSYISRIFILLIVALSLSFSSCKHQKLLKSDDHELKLTTAIEYYEEGRYSRSISLLHSVNPIYRGTQKAEKVNYYFAMAHYKQGDYIYAAHLFQTFYQTFPNSEHAEHFFFLSAYCKYLMSPRYNLDQTPTKEAIQQFQRFVNRYPNSERVEQANELIDELRLKLEKKAFNNAMLYYNLGIYNAAATAFQTVIVDYPDIKYREEAMFYIIDAYFRFAENSIAERQKERYQKAVTAYNRFVRSFPDSELRSRADNIHERSINRINEFTQLEASARE